MAGKPQLVCHIFTLICLRDVNAIRFYYGIAWLIRLFEIKYDSYRKTDLFNVEIS